MDKALLKSKSLTFEDAAEAADMVLLLFQEVSDQKPCDMSLMQFHEPAFFDTSFSTYRCPVPCAMTPDCKKPRAARGPDAAGRMFLRLRIWKGLSRLCEEVTTGVSYSLSSGLPMEETAGIRGQKLRRFCFASRGCDSSPHVGAPHDATVGGDCWDFSSKQSKAKEDKLETCGMGRAWRAWVVEECLVVGGAGESGGGGSGQQACLMLQFLHSRIPCRICVRNCCNWQMGCG